jgi:hypothetical protein
VLIEVAYTMQVIKPGGAGPTAWKALIPSLKPLVEKKVIVGFDLGDEIVWNGVKWTDLNDTGESQAPPPPPPHIQ